MRNGIDNWRLLSADEETELAAAMAAGDVSARNTLIETSIPWVLKLTRRRDDDDEDLESFVLLRVCKYMDGYSPTRGRLSTFVTCMVRTSMIEYYRQRYKRLRLRATSLMDHDSPRYNAQFLPFELELLPAAMAVLDDRERKIVTDSFVEQLTNVEIGRELRIGRERVRQLLNRSILKMRKVIDDVSTDKKT